MNTCSSTIVLAATLALGACARPAQLIRVDGSAGVAPLVAALADEWSRHASRDSIRVATGLGSGARATALLEGRIDVAMASHGIDTADLRRRGLAVHEIARTPVVFAVNAGVAIQAISGSQACDVLAGRITSWRELGGPDMPVVAATRPGDEVDAEVMAARVSCLRGLSLGPSVRVIARPDSMAAFITSTPGAFGITSGTFVSQSAGRIRALVLDGVAPAAAGVASGQAPFRSSFLLTTNTPPVAVRRFLAFIRAEQGRQVIVRTGGVPVR